MALTLAMLDSHDANVPAHWRGAARDDAFTALLMGAELGWTLDAAKDVDAAAWAAEVSARAGINAAFARLWGPWYGQRPEVVRTRKRDALGTAIQLATERGTS